MCNKNYIQIPTQIPPDEDDATSRTYADLLYAHLLDTEGSRLTYTHYTSRVQYNSLIEISFNRPIYIQKNKVSDYFILGVANSFIGLILLTDVQSWSCAEQNWSIPHRNLSKPSDLLWGHFYVLSGSGQRFGQRRTDSLYYFCVSTSKY